MVTCNLLNLAWDTGRISQMLVCKGAISLLGWNRGYRVQMYGSKAYNKADEEMT